MSENVKTVSLDEIKAIEKCPKKFFEDNPPPLAILKLDPGAKSSPDDPSRYFVVRPKEIAAVVANPAQFQSSHYDTLMRALGSDMVLMPGANDEGRVRRREVLRLAWVAHQEAGKGPDWLEKTTREASERVLRILRDGSDEQPRRFNFVWEYAMLVPYLVFADFYGIKFPVKRDLLTRAILFLRNALRPKSRLSSQGVQGEAWTLILWSQMLFAHLFANFKNGIVLRLFAKFGLVRLEKHFKFLAENPDALADDGFMATLIKVNDGLPADKQIDGAAISAMMIELLSTAVALPGTSLCKMADALYREPDDPKAGITLDQFLERIEDPDLSWKQFDELLRFAPLTPTMDRVAGDGAKLGDIDISRGDRVTLILKVAALDPAAFGPDPYKFDPQSDRPYLEFRPATNFARCFGRDWALTIHRQMLLALDGEFAARPVAGDDGNMGYIPVADLPDQMMFEFCEGQK